MTNQQFNPAAAVFTPPEVATYGKLAIERVAKNQQRGLTLGIPGVRDYLAPVLPGQLVSVIAQTSNYKSGFLHSWEQHAARQLEAEGRTDEVLVHVSVEEVIEEQAYLLLARETGEDAGRLAIGQVQDWDNLERAAIRIGTIPIYRIGESLARAEDFPLLTVSNMVRAIKYIAHDLHARKLKIAALFFDYLQAFPFDNEVKIADLKSQRRLQVRNDTYRLRQAAAQFDCPVVVAVQAKQHLDGAPGQNMLIPGIYDGEESAAIGQRSDRIIQLWMPKMSHSIGSIISHKDMSFSVDENLLFVKVGKQRGGLPSGKTWKCRIDFKHNTIAPEVHETGNVWLKLDTLEGETDGNGRHATI